MQPLIIKLSGKTLADRDGLKTLFLRLSGREVILVHGGGVEVDALLKRLDIVTPKKEGIRVSPAEAMPYITGMLAGSCNRSLQALALEAGLNALGLCATDGRSLELVPYPQEYGQVAHVRAESADFLTALLKNGYTPVISSIGLSQGTTFNINADEVAVELAALLKAPLLLVSDVPGVKDGSGRILEKLTRSEAETLIEDRIITEGMVIKVRSALQSASRTGNMLVLTNLERLTDPKLDLFSLRRLGTAFEA